MMGKSHDEVMIEYFRKHPAFAASLVNDILEDGSDQGELKYVFRHITGAGLRVSLVPAAAKAKPRARAKAGAAKTAAKRARQAPAAKRATAAKTIKAAKAAPATKRTKAVPSALPAGAGRSRPAMAAAGA